MPIYEYECRQCGACLERVVLGGHEPATCGEECRLEEGRPGWGEGRLDKVISRSAAIRKPDALGRTAGYTDSHLERMGFTKYVNEGNGRYRKATGKGPDSLSADD